MPTLEKRVPYVARAEEQVIHLQLYNRQENICS